MGIFKQNQESEKQMGHFRVLKFRAWDKKLNRMWSWEELKNLPLSDLETRKDLDFMQLTGLKDKNGVEIFCDDIIEIKNDVSKGKYRVDWDSEKGEWCIVDDLKPKKYSLGIFIRRICGIGNKIEIIGNIYENPELLIK